MKIIYGPKGTGKTKLIIDSANEVIDTAKGHVVFITDTKRYNHDIKYAIRLLNVKEFGIDTIEGLCGFIKGVVASNGDNEYVYIDGVARITGKELGEMKDVFDAIETLEKDAGVTFVVTCSAAKEDLPDFVAKYV